jgi:hypothetical protein
MSVEQAIRNAALTEHRLRTVVGHGKRVRRKAIPVQPVLAIEILRLSGWSIDFRADSEEMIELGAKTIWRYIAYLHPIDDSSCFLRKPSQSQRWESSRDHHEVVRQAFVSLCRHLIVDNRETPLMMVPRIPGRKLTEVITFDKYFQVNETMIAEDLYRAGVSRGIENHARSGLEKLEAIGGPEAMRDGIKALTKELEEFANRSRQPMLRFSDDQAEANPE